MAQHNEVFRFWPWLQSLVWFCSQNLVSDLRNPFLFSVFYKVWFRTTVLSGANFLMFVSAQGTENCTSNTYMFHKIADYLPVIEKIYFAFLLSLSRFSLYDRHVLSVWIFCIMPSWSFTKWKASVPTWQTGSCSYRVLSYRESCQATRITFLAFCTGDLLSESQSLLLPSPSLQGLGRFPFWCWNLPFQTLYDESCTFESTAQKNPQKTCRPEIIPSY